MTSISSPTPSSYASSSPTSTTSSKRARVSAEHTLSRVRENQRRHRARRKDYIATLEQKLAETEAQLAAARTEIEKLREEKEARQAHHGDGGAGKEYPYPRVDTSMSMSMSIEMLALERLVDTLPAPPLGDVFAFSLPSPSPDADSAQLSPDVTATLDDALIPLTGPPPCCTDIAPEPTPPSPECTTCHTRPAPLPTESTTLCAQAYVLIAQQNFRGIDAGTIRLWLWQGYRRARREGEGCRVENGALFRLLDYISGGV
ncbi:hypothetical protein DPSP01_001121 [Paraphaeosphaeria sporulosa]